VKEKDREIAMLRRDRDADAGAMKAMRSELDAIRKRLGM